MYHKTLFTDIDELINRAILEDIGSGDITSEAIFNPQDISEAVVISKEDGIFCGGDVFKHVYEIIDAALMITQIVKDGDSISIGDETIKISGPTLSILKGERIAMNFIQRMSGIASATARYVFLLKGTGIRILDTRKTVPGFRALDKYAVKTGGGTNHRMGLFDMIMIKDNHIKAAGSISQAVRLVRDKYGTRFKVEVETTNSDEVREAVEAGADIIMLDNMKRDLVIEAIDIINKRAKIEVSGNIDESRIKGLAELDIDYISTGALTHSVKAFDLSMKFA